MTPIITPDKIPNIHFITEFKDLTLALKKLYEFPLSVRVNL